MYTNSAILTLYYSISLILILFLDKKYTLQLVKFAGKDIVEVKKEVAAWLEGRNKDAHVVDWRFTIEDARIKLKKLYPTIGKINETL